MIQDFNDIKREILKKNLMINAIYGGDNSNRNRLIKMRLEKELDGLLYRYFKYRSQFQSKNDSFRNFEE